MASPDFERPALGTLPPETVFAKLNLAEAPAIASIWLADHPPKDAFDGRTSTSLNAGGGSPQWVEIDLGTPPAISKITLNPE